MNNIFIKVMLFLCAVSSWAAENNIESESRADSIGDLETSATSAKLLNLGGLLGGGNGGYYPTNYRPTYYPSGGYYPSSGYNPSSGYYPTSARYPTSGYYPSSGYPSSGYPSSGYYPTSGYYPSSGTYPNTATPNIGWNTGGYYPTTGTNFLGGNGGYGGYGGNGGLRQYDGYWNPNYVGHRNLGYGYFRNTDRYGLPKTNKDRYGGGRGGRDRDHVSPSFKGYD